MNELVSTIRSSCFLLVLAVGLAACSDDGGTSQSSLYFSVNGRGDCSNVRVEFARPQLHEDEVECVLDEMLIDAGCDLDVEELPDDLVRAEISGCDIDAKSRLFRCGLDEDQLDEVRALAFADCTCSSFFCSASPPVCVGTAFDDPHCEDCRNGLDDDDNGYIDCEDRNCSYSFDCVEDTTTTSTTHSHVSSTSSTSTTMPGEETSTTTLRLPSRYTVTFALDDATGISALEIEIGYGEALARATSLLSSPSCISPNLPGDAEFDYDDANEVIHVSVTDLDAEGPVELAKCTFETDTPPAAGTFAIEVTEALDDEGDPVAQPDVVVTDVTPATSTTTTTTTTTSSTSSTTTSSTTTTTRPPFQDAYTVEFRMLASSAEIGALQWSVDYSSATGEFRGKGAFVECYSGIDNVIFAANDLAYCSLQPGGAPCDPEHPGSCYPCSDDAQCADYGSLGTCSVVDLNLVRFGVVGRVPFGAPKIVVQCAFDGTPDDPPVAEDFPIVLEDVTDDEGEPASVTMDVIVTAPNP